MACEGPLHAPGERRPDNAKLAALAKKVKVAEAEVVLAEAFHEAWKPAAYDKDVHSRMGRSQATYTFLVVRSALRRELILSLSRLWGSRQDELNLITIGRDLRAPGVLEAVKAEITSRRPLLLDDEESPPVTEFQAEIEQQNTEIAQSEAAWVLSTASDALATIARYSRGGDRYAALEVLKRVRHDWLAHRSLQVNPEETGYFKKLDHEMEEIHRDTRSVVMKLLLVVNAHNHDFDASAAVRRRQSELFWAGVRGETTEGHPQYALRLS